METKPILIFVHGYTASSKADWYPAISKLLHQANVDFIIPDLPGGEHPHANEWIETLHREIPVTGSPLIFIGHSLGTRAVLLYLERYRIKVDKVFLIAAFANSIENANRHDDGRAYEDFFDHVIDIQSIKVLIGQTVVVHAMNDSSIEYTQAEAIAKDLEAKLVTFQDRDHFSEPSNAEAIFQILAKEIGF